MIDFERGLYVRIEELPRGPQPFPLQHGFTQGTAYRVLAIYNPSESGECWLVLSNDRDELWYISQRHVRSYRILDERRDLRIEIPAPAQAPGTVDNGMENGRKVLALHQASCRT